MPKGWSAQDERRVIDLFNARTPASKIGKEFGVSRNSILGLIHRLRDRHGEAVVMRQRLSRRKIVSPRPKVTKVRRRKLRTEPPESVLSRQELRAKALEPSPNQDPVFLIDRAPSRCAWPIWHDDTPANAIDPAMVCGGSVHVTANGRSSYCKHHHEVAYVPRASRA